MNNDISKGEKRVHGEYLNWLYDLVCTDSKTASYHELFGALYGTKYYYIHPLDENRIYDGLDMRKIYASKRRNSEKVFDIINSLPCSVLEVMVGTCYRCENTIATNSDFGDRTGQWFWVMIKNLGLEGLADGRFDERKFNRAMDIFLNRKYDHDGKGGPFYIRNSKRDMRELDLWMQFNIFLTDYFYKNGEMPVFD